jgi:hypothetical protein
MISPQLRNSSTDLFPAGWDEGYQVECTSEILACDELVMVYCLHLMYCLCCGARHLCVGVQLLSCYGPTDTALLLRILRQQLLPTLLLWGSRLPLLPAAAIWDVAAAVARAGWQRLGIATSSSSSSAAGHQGEAVDGDGSAGGGGSSSGGALINPLGVAAAVTGHLGGRNTSARQLPAASLEGDPDSAAPQDGVTAALGEALAFPDSRAAIMHKVAVKQLREVELQQAVMTELLPVLLDRFNTERAAAAAGAGSSNSSMAAAALFHPNVSGPAWQGVQLACYITRCLLQLWEGPKAADVARLSSAVAFKQQLQQQLTHWEFALVERHVFYSLTSGLQYCMDSTTASQLAAEQQQQVLAWQQQQLLDLPKHLPSGDGKGTSSSSRCCPISQLLLADWISCNIRHPDLSGEQLLRPAASVYATFGCAAPLAAQGAMPCRELNPLDPADLAPTGLTGAGVAAARVADIAAATLEADDGQGVGDKAAGAAAVVRIPWPRCGASLMLCPAADSTAGGWGCSVCGRRYRWLPSKALLLAGSFYDDSCSRNGDDGGSFDSNDVCTVSVSGPPTCLVCGVRLSPGGAAAVGCAGTTAAKAIVDGSPVLAVGMSLSDVLLQ